MHAINRVNTCIVEVGYDSGDGGRSFKINVHTQIVVSKHTQCSNKPDKQCANIATMAWDRKYRVIYTFIPSNGAHLGFHTATNSTMHNNCWYIRICMCMHTYNMYAYVCTHIHAHAHIRSHTISYRYS